MSMKKGIFQIILKIFLLFFILGLVFLGQTYFFTQSAVNSGEKLAKSILNNQPENFRNNYETWQKNFNRLKKRIFEIDDLSGGLINKKFQAGKYFEIGDRISLVLPEIVGEKGQKTYFVLLQNNRELRPTGGFLGSYAKLKFRNGGLAEVDVQDIYVPDGQISGHVDPPWPIQEAFKQGFWKLRDANWDPDFPRAAKVIDWFFQKGKEEKSDGMVAINLVTIQKILKVLGPFYLADYHQNVGAENLYQVIQQQVQTNFFPGSIQKKEILSDLGKILLEKIKQVNRKEAVKIFPIIFQDLEEKQILISFEDSSLAGVFKKLGWDGSMKLLDLSSEDFLNDYLFLVEANLGVNKANCCIERKVRQEIYFLPEKIIKEKLFIDYQNSSPADGKVPLFWGGKYDNFLRIYLPQKAEKILIRVGDVIIRKEEILLEKREDLGLQGIGFFVNVPPVSSKKVEINYQIPIPELILSEKFIYRLIVQKQSGIESYSHDLAIFLGLSQTEEFQEVKDIFKDEEFLFQFVYNKVGQEK